jgi:hypothetical protein
LSSVERKRFPWKGTDARTGAGDPARPGCRRARPSRARRSRRDGLLAPSSTGSS